MSNEKPQYLKHGESFVRARRNYILSTVTLIVLAAANPDTLKIPGLGDDATLPSVLAFPALWLAMLYFAWEFYIEHTYVSLYNSDAANKADAEDQALLDQLRMRIDTLSAEATQIANIQMVASLELDPQWHLRLDEEAIGAIKGSLSQAVWITERMMTNNAIPGAYDSDSYEKAIDGFSHTVDQKILELTGVWELKRNELDRRLSALESQVAPQLPIIAERLGENSEALKALDATYRNVSKRVHATLRHAFRWKDTGLAIALGVIATVMMVVPLFGYEWIWYDW